jgi:hypothetical protein
LFSGALSIAFFLIAELKSIALAANKSTLFVVAFVVETPLLGYLCFLSSSYRTIVD